MQKCKGKPVDITIAAGHAGFFAPVSGTLKRIQAWRGVGIDLAASKK